MEDVLTLPHDAWSLTWENLKAGRLGSSEGFTGARLSILKVVHRHDCQGGSSSCGWLRRAA